MRIAIKWVLASMFVLSACGAQPGGGGDEGGGEDGGSGPEMRPGENCKSCHDFSAAGTVFGAKDASASEGLKGATITLKDAAGVVATLTSNGTGNFYTSKSLKFPLTASITQNGATKSMAEPVTSGGCASCHSASPSGGAPGRLFISPE